MINNIVSSQLAQTTKQQIKPAFTGEKEVKTITDLAKLFTEKSPEEQDAFILSSQSDQMILDLLNATPEDYQEASKKEPALFQKLAILTKNVEETLAKFFIDAVSENIGIAQGNK